VSSIRIRQNRRGEREHFEDEGKRRARSSIPSSLPPSLPSTSRILPKLLDLLDDFRKVFWLSP